ncbi:MAG: hypothetical protein AB8H12_23805 [Lewinella sp.]
MHLLRFVVLTVLLSCTGSVFGQINCYDSSLNHSGVNPAIDSLEYHACQIDEGLPAAVTSNFKVFSAVEYTLHKYKDQADITRYRENTIDSLRQLNPFNLIFWWSPAEGNDLFGRCDLAFTYPSDDEFQTCFTSIRTAIIASQLQSVVESELATGSFGGNNYRGLEQQVLSLLREKIEAIQGCCASTANKSEDACSPCPVGEELLDLKGHAHLYEVGTSTPVETGTIEVTLVENGTSDKSNTGFINLVGGKLIFGDLEIDVEAKYNEFLNLGDTICVFPAYFTTDETLCLLDIDWDRGDRTIINIASLEEGNILEMSEYDDTDCYLFGDYLIDEYPAIFGGRLFESEAETFEVFEPGSRGANEENEPEPSIIKGHFAPSGAIVNVQDPNSNGSFRRRNVKLVRYGTSASPTNTLLYFTYGVVGYKYFSSNISYAENGYYDQGGVREWLFGDKRKRNVESFKEIESFTKKYDWAIAKIEDTRLVTGFKDNNCLGIQQCFWETSPNVTQLEGDRKEVVIHNSAVCRQVEPANDICCELGRAYVNDHLESAGEDSTKRNAILSIAGDLCVIGEALFEEYENNVWENTPDLLKMHYELNYYKYIEECATGCSYDSLKLSINNFKERVLLRLDSVEVTNGWTAMKALIDSYSDAEISALSAEQRIHVIKELGKFLNDSYRFTVFGTAIRTRSNEASIIRVLSSVSVDKCPFANALFTDEVFLDSLFIGFNDREWGFIGDGNYPQMVQAMLTLFTDCPSLFNRVVDTTRRYNEFVYIGNEILRDEDGEALDCEVKIVHNGGRSYTVKNPYVELQEITSDLEPTYVLGYRSICGTNERNGTLLNFSSPVEFVPVFVQSANYGGLSGLEKKMYLLPEFMFKYFSDYQIHEIFANNVNAAIFVVTVVLTAGEATFEVGLLRVLAAIDLAATVGTQFINQEINSTAFKERFGDDNEAYKDFVKDYKKFESVLNAGLFSAGVLIGVGSYARSVNRSARVVANRTGSTVFSKLDEVTQALGPEVWNGHNFVKSFASRLDNIPDEFYEFSEELVRKLDADLARKSTSARELFEAELRKPSGLTAYKLLDDFDEWRPNPDVVRQLSIDLEASPLLKSRLLDDGDHGVMAWKLMDDNLSNPTWCPN